MQGREVHETRCLCCETVTKNETDFYALSLAITQNSSLTHALRSFRCAFAPQSIALTSGSLVVPNQVQPGRYSEEGYGGIAQSTTVVYDVLCI